MIAFLCHISCVLHWHPREIEQFVRKRKNKTNVLNIFVALSTAHLSAKLV